MCLKHNIKQVKKEDFTHNKTSTNICFTNKMRKQVNHEKMMEAHLTCSDTCSPWPDP